MTYSHNSISNNLKMTTTAAAAAATSTAVTSSSRARNKKAAQGDNISPASPPKTPPLTAHSNSIVSTNINKDPSITSSCFIPLGVLTPLACINSGNSNGSDDSLISSQRHQQNQSRQCQWQQQSQPQHLPQQMNVGGNFFSNNQQYYQNHCKQRYNGGNSQKQRDGQRSPNVRQSPAIILGGGSSGACISPGSSGSTGRKSRAKHTMLNQSPLLYSNNGNGTNGGKISPTNPLIPTALTHFAGSKWFDAPAPTALPKPPQHWTLSKAEQKTDSSAGIGLQNITKARFSTLAVDAHTYGGHVVKSFKRNLLDDFDTHNLKLLLNVQS